MKKLKIAAFYNVPHGGAKRAFKTLCEQLRAKGHSLDLYTLSTSDAQSWSDENIFSKKNIYPIESYKYWDLRPAILAKFISTFRRLRQIKKADWVEKQIAQKINQGGYDLFYSDVSMLSQAPFVLKYVTIPAFYFCHEPYRKGYEPVLSTENPRGLSKISAAISKFPVKIELYFRRKWDRENSRSAQNILCNSYYTREYIYRAHGRFAQVCYLGVDNLLFRPVSNNRKNYVLSVGRIILSKGHQYVIRALSYIPKEKRPPLMIVGDSADADTKTMIINLAREYEVQLEIKEFVTDEELVQSYSEAFCVVAASIMEPFGFIPLEAMASGTPVIAVNEGGFRETVHHGETGLLCERDEKDIAEKIWTLRSNPELHEKLKHNGLAFVLEKWTWKHAGDRLEKIFCEKMNHKNTFESKRPENAAAAVKS